MDLPSGPVLNFNVCATKKDVLSAVDILRCSPYIVLDCEGRSIGKVDGALSIISVGSAHAEHIFLFDALTLKSVATLRPLLRLLSSPKILKVMWDGRNDALEISEQYRTTLDGILDMQLVEVVSRTSHRGEGQKERIERLSTNFPAWHIRKNQGMYDGIQIVLGMQKCLDAFGLGGGIQKDPEVTAMHRANGSAVWMDRPLDPRLLHYAACDIYMLAAIHQYFLSMRWIEDPRLVQISSRYLGTQLTSGRSDGRYRAGAIIPPDVLYPPGPLVGACTVCEKAFSLKGFYRKTSKKKNEFRSARCIVCSVMAHRWRLPREDAWVSLQK